MFWTDFDHIMNSGYQMSPNSPSLFKDSARNKRIKQSSCTHKRGNCTEVYTLKKPEPQWGDLVFGYV